MTSELLYQTCTNCIVPPYNFWKEKGFIPKIKIICIAIGFAAIIYRKFIKLE